MSLRLVRRLNNYLFAWAQKSYEFLSAKMSIFSDFEISIEIGCKQIVQSPLKILIMKIYTELVRKLIFK